METVMRHGQLYRKEIVPKAPGDKYTVINYYPVLTKEERERREREMYRKLSRLLLS